MRGDLKLKFGHWLFATLLVTGLLLPGCSRPHREEASNRQRVLLDADWRFQPALLPKLTDAVNITAWRWKPDESGGTDTAAAGTVVDTDSDGWRSGRTGDDVFKGRVGFAWFRTLLPEVPGPGHILRFEGVDDNATVYLNGRKLAEHQGWNDPFVVGLDAAWNPGGSNTLAVLVENTGGIGGITVAVSLGWGKSPASAGNPADPDFDDSGWRTVHLPHDYVVEGAFTSAADTRHGSLPVSAAWYRKTFTLPASAEGRSVWIDFDGIYRNSVIYLNGRKLGGHASGYTSFRYDISQVAKYGEQNVLAVFVDPRQFEGWWYEGGGIYRHVWLNVGNQIHVAPWGTFVTAKLPEPAPYGKAGPATLNIQTTVTNESSANGDCTLVSEVVDDRGKTVATVSSAVTVPAGDRQEVAQQVRVGKPRLWSLETPRLYRVITTVHRDGRTVDAVETTFGIRTIRFDADQGFFLNGRAVKLQGTCNHQDFAGLGIAVPDTLEYWRVGKLKAMGANAWRMSHNPPTPELLNACDELGMLVMDENRHLDDSDANLADVADMVRRDRNHPSIIMWSLCNEEGRQGSPEGARIFSAMMKVVRQYDTTRPVTSAMNGGWFDRGIGTVEDLMGINYNPQIYDQFHQGHPEMPMFGSETASTVTTRGEYADNREKTFVTSYNMTDDTWRPVAERAFVAGSFVWTGFDYKGEPTPYGWPCINSHFGIMDMCGFPKDNYYYYQSWWKTKPVVHVMPHWNWPGREGQDIKVIVFGNCERVELFLNGWSQGAREMPRNGHLEWTVKYAPGTLSAKGFNGHKVAATDAVETTGTPASLSLKADRTTLTADGEDVVPVEVDVLDAKGRVVPTADDLVTFNADGAGFIAGVGNGNPGDHDPDKANYRHAFHGKCLVVIGAGEKGGPLRLKATAPGLRAATLDLRVASPLGKN